MTITVAVTVKRSSGVAPLAVFLDASATTATGVTRPIHELLYRWNFGKTGAGNWQATDGSGTGRSKNIAFGPWTCAIYETAGTYTVTLQVWAADGSTANYTTTVTVSDPDTVFSGNNTICFSTSGTFTSSPAGSLQVTTSDFDAAIATYKGSGKRLLFRATETFNSSTFATINVTGPGTIGSFGAGAKPIITGSGFALLDISSVSTPGLTDWRIMDLKLQGNNFDTSSDGVQWSGGMDQVTLLRLDFDGCYQGVSADHGTLDAANLSHAGHTLFDQIAVVECTATGTIPDRYGAYLSGQYVAMLGNSFNNANTGSHVTRHPSLTKAVISNNIYQLPKDTRDVIRVLSATEISPYSGVAPQFSSHVITSDNKLVSGLAGSSASAGYSASYEFGNQKNIIHERNWQKFENDSGALIAVGMAGTDMTVRNNVFDMTGTNNNAVASKFTAQGGEAVNGGFAYNNVVYHGGSITGLIGCQVADVAVTGVVVKNNLGYAPTCTTPTMLDAGGTTVTSSNNTTNDQFTGTNPFAGSSFTVPADFVLSGSAYAKDGGATVPVFDDFMSLSRVGLTLDDGPLELGAIAFAEVTPTHSLVRDGIWKAGVWATTVWKSGVWIEGTPTTAGTQNSGGYGYGGGRRRTKDDIRRGRQAVGLLPPDVAAIVRDVAIEASEQYLGMERAVEELEIELAAIRVDVKEAYIEALRQEIGALSEELASVAEMELIAVFAIALDH
jgi:hypothetical protein